jgi:cell division septal protein FtsQ
MRFLPSRRNRRHARYYVLDVKLSARQRRRNRWRRTTLAFVWLLMLAAAGVGSWLAGDYLLRRYVYENPALSIRRLEIETDGVLSAEQIRSWAGVRRNDNVIALDLGRVERDLKLVPAIETVVVERVLPNGLRIRITEREPIAQVTLPLARAGAMPVSTHYMLDANGYFMFPIEGSQRATVAATNDSLPLVTGIPAQDIRPGRPSDSPQVRAALALVQAFQRSPMAGLVDLKQVAVDSPGALIVTTGQGNEITFALQNFAAQLGRWRLVHDHAQRFGKHVVSLDLAVANHSPLIWTDVAGMTPPPPPKPLKVSPYKKKHV